MKEQKSTRIATLDWTKGALVVCMVIYHAINYSAFRRHAFELLAFLPPSFILIAGFVVGQIYAAKYDLQSWQPYVRLAIRGLKLLLLFTALNVVYCIGLEHGLLDGLAEFGERAPTIFLSGNGRASIFEVILPISYFLLLAPLLLWLRGRARAIVGVCAIAIFILCCGLERNGNSFKNLELFSVGIIGMALGLIPLATIDRVAKQGFPALVLYGVYRVCVYKMGETYPLQVFGAAVSILLLFYCALHLRLERWIGRQMVLFGRYSLLGYLAQIALLQIIVKLIGLPQHVAGVIEVSAVALVLTYGIVRGVHELRQRRLWVDAGYKLVFA